MSNGIKRIYSVMLVLAGLFILAAIISENGKRNEPNLLYMESDRIIEENEHTTSYYFDVESKSLGGQGIAFFTNHQNVTVYCNDARVYELQQADSPWGHTTGSVWNFIHLPYETKEVCIQLEQVYDSYAMENFYVIAGNDSVIYNSLLEGSALAMACSVIIIVIGVGLIIIWAVVRKKTKSVSNVLYLGILSILFGLWSFNETDGVAILFDDRIASSFAAFVLLKLLSPTLILFIREFTGERRDTVWEIFLVFSQKQKKMQLHLFLFICYCENNTAYWSEYRKNRYRSLQ